MRRPVLFSMILMGLLILSATAFATEVTFVVEAPGAGQVFLAGSFNGWSTDADAMTKGDGVFTLVKDLSTGDYLFKFVIDGTWTEPQNAPAYDDDGFGGRNGKFTVGNDPVTVGGDAGSVVAAAPATAVTGGGEATVSFTFEPKTGGVRDVFLAGDFNDWSDSKDRMQDEDGDGVYEITVKMTAGLHSYKFVVDGTWLADENAEDFEDDGHGGQNSVIMVGSEGGGSGMFKVVFRHAAAGASSVFAAGSFNDWNSDKNAMRDDDGDGVWELALILPAGEIQYKFVVDGNWTTDKEGADSFADDGFGGENSVLNVDGRFEGVDRKRGDGKIDEGSLQFTPGFPDLNRVTERMLEVTFRTAADDVDEVTVFFNSPISSQSNPSLAMTLVASDNINDLWRAEINHPNEDLGLLFRVKDAAACLVYDADGIRASNVDRAARDINRIGDLGRPLSVTLADLPTFFTPDWVKDGIFYQIFPDRFRNGDKSNDPDFTEWYYQGANKLPRSGKTNDEYFHMVEDWNNYGGLTRSPYRTDGRPDYFSFYGGDIAGVQEKLDYLVDLGVTILYFNPVTEGKSNHKYDATDYNTVDPHFATKEEFRSFVDEAHARDIRVVVEAVYNHCGDTHWAFVDSRDKGRESEYWNWYEWKKWPLPKSKGYKAADYYECWWGFGLHPNLNFDLSRPDGQESGVKDITQAQPNMPVVDHLLGVAEYWLTEMDVDGFRMDVPNDVPFWFWNLFNEKVKSIKPDAYLLGELWGYSPDWIGPDIFDATMNYKYFRDPVTRWIGRGAGNAASFEKAMAPGRTGYPSQAVQVMMNLYDSHDTVRFKTLAGGDARRLRMAALLNLTYLGVPHIWYGNEIGMEGEKDPDCRRPFYWNYTDNPERVSMHAYYRKLCHIRQEHEALRRGSLRVVKARGDDYAFLREGGGERIISLIHNGESSGVVKLDLAAMGLEDGDWRFLVGGSDPRGGTAKAVNGELELNMPPLSGAVLIQE
ncbi:MAG: hypothetical protein GY835_12245 [bacterium]|nr:hypothetical protein [bacterium]